MSALLRTAPALAAVAAVLAAPAAAGGGSETAPATARGPAPGGGDRVEVLVPRSAGRPAAPCPPVDSGGRFVRGGCSTVVQDFSTDLSIRTALGEMAFASCLATIDVTFDRRGRVWLDNIRIGGTPPCGDIWVCAPRSVIASREDETDTPPPESTFAWTGRIAATAGGRFTGAIDLCVETCAGRFRGRTPIELVRSEEGWTLRVDGGVGTGGLAIQGEWDLGDDVLEPRAAGS